ncbi:deoxyribodipyrimidine photo-lyase [Oleiagrimonas sp. C23AA]|uniref:cryptochrome/photolyase family protein n=1 Tax=Oleiagrimonas sp. C23AA TaxID=2719047 RepID=UPI00141F26C1|nr:deoxyribodipyrimidine photo-lyase [Oleiagrimonas sp. C23AA]NII10913.1 deoxyribodipyrimidine photo-lyase [Oleiagrimonas sp. C23AA]
MSLAIVWLRQDLRLADHPALSAAARHHEHVLAVYIHAPEEEGDWAPGAATRWWLHHSLEHLNAQLHQRHGALHLRRGPSLQALRGLIEQTGADAVYWNRRYEPAAIERDATIKRALRDDGLHVASFDAALWRTPWQVKTQQGEPYRVFTPFWRNLRSQLGEEAPLPVPQPLHLASADAGVSLHELDLLPSIDWTGGLAEAWQPGETGAHEMLDIFADDALNAYASQRDVPARHGTSRLSPHLHFGEITPRQILARLRKVANDGRRKPAPDIEPYLRELGWREFAHHLLFHYPQTTHAPMNARFAEFPWSDDADARQRWQRGRTGIPIVDAGMRELWHTGWMHNRVRMIVASLLTKNLRQHWRQGAEWFWDTLVDADLANNTLGWQWVAGCGADAAPYFRIFNPVTQARKFDPDGAYIRRWVKELSGVSAPAIFAPWEQQGLNQRCGYPLPIVDLKTSRQKALDAYGTVKG